jgi:hypothetical protein
VTQRIPPIYPTVQVSLSVQAFDALKLLVATGLFGASIELAAEELLRAKLRETLLRGEHLLGKGKR